VRLNAKYMINIAESRGLFGGEGGVSKEGKKSQSGRQQRKKPDLQRSGSDSPPLIRPKSQQFKLEIERIAAPTQASIMRRATYQETLPSGCPQEETSSSSTGSCCPRFQNHFQHEGIGFNRKLDAQIRRQDVRKWWMETATFILTFGFSLASDQYLPDENSRPRLKLTRTRPCARIPFPMSIQTIKFDDPHENLNL